MTALIPSVIEPVKVLTPGRSVWSIFAFVVVPSSQFVFKSVSCDMTCLAAYGVPGKTPWTFPRVPSYAHIMTAFKRDCEWKRNKSVCLKKFHFAEKRKKKKKAPWNWLPSVFLKVTWCYVRCSNRDPKVWDSVVLTSVHIQVTWQNIWVPAFLNNILLSNLFFQLTKKKTIVESQNILIPSSVWMKFFW